MFEGDRLTWQGCGKTGKIGKLGYGNVDRTKTGAARLQDRPKARQGKGDHGKVGNGKGGDENFSLDA